MLVDFGRVLRAARARPSGSGDVLTYCAAMEPLDPTDVVDLYWAGRTTLVTRREQIPTYDRVFRRYFLDEGDDEASPCRRTVRAKARSPGRRSRSPIPGPRPSSGTSRRPGSACMASDVDAAARRSRSPPARPRSWPRCAGSWPGSGSPRRAGAPDGRTRAERGPRPDLRRTVRETLRTHGEPADLYWRRRRRCELRPLILILDVSGSMSDYSREPAAVRLLGPPGQHQGRGLLLRHPAHPHHPGAASAAVRTRRWSRPPRLSFDWDGGTRIGDSLTTFVRDWGGAGTCRGGIVVICSDGLDRGDPDVLAKAMERLARLSHRVVWINPNLGDGGLRPDTLGMAVAAPHVDELLSGHDLASLERFVERLPALG